MQFSAPLTGAVGRTWNVAATFHCRSVRLNCMAYCSFSNLRQASIDGPPKRPEDTKTAD